MINDMQHIDIQKAALDNTDFRREIFTNEYSQVVLMSLLPGEEIGEEVHHLDQILIFVAGEGTAILNDEAQKVLAGSLVCVPAGTKHNFINNGEEALKLYTIYAPPEHLAGTVHKTKAEADAAEHSHA